MKTRRKRENSIDSLVNQSFINRDTTTNNNERLKQENDVKDLKNKMDYLIKKFEKIENMREIEENLTKSKNKLSNNVNKFLFF